MPRYPVVSRHVVYVAVTYTLLTVAESMVLQSKANKRAARSNMRADTTPYIKRLRGRGRARERLDARG